jgi:DNA-binding NarL/FixJ family response regulator
MPIKVAIYEDHHALRDSLQLLIAEEPKLALTGAYPDCNQIEEDLRTQPADIVLMDIDLPGRSGIAGAAIVREKFPATEVLMLTVFDDDDKVFRAVCAGANGYLLKKTPPEELLAAIVALHYGAAPMTPAIARKVLHLFRRNPPAKAEAAPLTPRELEVLDCLSKGNSYKMVAAELDISIETVRSHIKKIYDKLHVHSLAGAIAKAYLK